MSLRIFEYSLKRVSIDLVLQKRAAKALLNILYKRNCFEVSVLPDFKLYNPLVNPTFVIIERVRVRLMI